MHVEPLWQPDLALTRLAHAAGATWHMSPMLATWALTGTPDGQRPGYYTYRWCFASQDDLLAAVAVWNPVTMDEPTGHVKRKGERRFAPCRDALPEYNRDRCAHGHYVAAGDCPRVACEAWRFAP